MLNILTLTKALQQLRTDASIDFTNNIPLKHARNRVSLRGMLFYILNYFTDVLTKSIVYIHTI